MAELIDRDKCQERIFRFADRLGDWGHPKEAKAVRAVAKGIKLEKTVDAVEVVRCDECVHSAMNGGDCSGIITMYHRDHLLELNVAEYIKLEFCSYGERRTDG